MYSSKYLGKGALLMTLSLMGAVSTSLDGLTLTSKVNQLDQPTIFWSHQGKRSGDTPIQLCGFRLLDTVLTLCRGRGSGFVRRSDSTLSGISERHEPLTSEVAADGSNFSNEVMYSDMDNVYSDMEVIRGLNTKSLALKILGKNKSYQRFKRATITDECCKKPCNFSHMMKYC